MRLPSLRLLCATMLWASVNAQAQSAPAATAPIKERVTFKSGDLNLVGVVLRPAGKGPFPVVIWNHGSEKNPAGAAQFDSVAGVFVPAGYMVFAPVRRGHSESQGSYIVDSATKVREANGVNAALQLNVHLMETEQRDDVFAGITYARHLPYADSTRVAVAGCSYGGIQTLLAAERGGSGIRAAISISPAAQSWEGNAFLRSRMVHAVEKINVPVMIIQPPKDASLEPIHVIGAEFERLHKTYVGKIYPATGPEELQTHCFGGAKGMHIWASDAVAFLKPYMK